MNQSHPTRRLGATLLLVLAGATALPGCTPLIIGGAMVGGGLMAIDRRTSGTQIEDEAIEIKAASRVRDLATFGHVNITSYNRQVLLTGEVPTAADRTRVGDTVGRLDNVRAVQNELVVAGNSDLNSRSNDTLLSTKVKTTLAAAKDVQASAVKVVTERGEVFLMGRVTEAEAARAGELASTIAGVRKVVRVFEIITPEELAALQPPRPSSPPSSSPLRQ